jgi:hypothetical protein
MAPLKFVTREHAKVDRIACPWVIRRFVDPKAEFEFVPRETVLDVAQRTGATPFDAPGAELHHYREGGEERVSFDAVLRHYHLSDPALVDLAEIVRGADAELPRPRTESAGLRAMADGFQRIARDDHDNMEKQFPAYDALYAYCQSRVRSAGKREPTTS